jgi:hypothetical protein
MQMEYGYEDLLKEMKQVSGPERKRLQRRLHEVRKQSLAIREIIEATHAAQ